MISLDGISPKIRFSHQAPPRKKLKFSKQDALGHNLHPKEEPPAQCTKALQLHTLFQCFIRVCEHHKNRNDVVGKKMENQLLSRLSDLNTEKVERGRLPEFPGQSASPNRWVPGQVRGPTSKPNKST